MTVPVQRLVAAIDLGSTKVVGVIGEVTGDARSWGLRILGVGAEPSSGVRRGVIRDFEETVRAVSRAMEAAERIAGLEVGTVYCGVSGATSRSDLSHGVASVTGSEIRTADLARVNDVACSISFGNDQELLHADPVRLPGRWRAGTTATLLEWRASGSRRRCCLVTVRIAGHGPPAQGDREGWLECRRIRA